MQTDYTVPPHGSLSPEAARPYLTAIYGHYCFRCGLKPNDERPKMDVDHIIPVARGGGNYFGAYQYLCGPCNSWKGTQIIDFRPGDRRTIDAGLPIIPNDERVRKSAIKVILPSPAPPSLSDNPAWQALAPAAANVVTSAIDSNNPDAVRAAKEMMAATISFEHSAAIERDPSHAARAMLRHYLGQLNQAIDAAVLLRKADDQWQETMKLAERAISGWEVALGIENRNAESKVEGLEAQVSLTRELNRIYRQRNRREKVIALLTVYAVIVTTILVWLSW